MFKQVERTTQRWGSDHKLLRGGALECVLAFLSVLIEVPCMMVLIRVGQPTSGCISRKYRPSTATDRLVVSRRPGQHDKKHKQSLSTTENVLCSLHRHGLEWFEGMATHGSPLARGDGPPHVAAIRAGTWHVIHDSGTVSRWTMACSPETATVT